MATVFLGVPHYGNLVAGAIDSLIQASKKHRLYLHTAGGSLLAYVFNSLWCRALNMNPRPDYFAMHHSDIQAEPGWLDKLIEEAKFQQSDITSVVIPIKDNRGLTSTAKMDHGGNITRLTLTEVHGYPSTFSEHSLNYDTQPHGTLLVNTGLMLIDFRKPWVEEFHFTIADAIKKNDKGRFNPCVLPEDWGMSKWAAERKLRVNATRRVKASHYGQAGFPNDKPIGEWQHDQGDVFA